MVTPETVSEAAIRVLETIGHAMLEAARQLRQLQSGERAHVNLTFET